MTISTTINRKEYVGDGSSTSFSFPYFVIAAADLKVYQNGTLKTIITHYTLSGSAPYSSGTNVQFVTAPALDDEIVIIRDPAITQAVDLVDNDPLPAASIETPLDRLTMIAQRQAEQIERSVHLPDADVSGASTELPTPSASKLIGWDSAGTALANYAAASIADTIVPTAFMETLLDDASASAARSTLGALASAGGTVTGDITMSGAAIVEAEGAAVASASSTNIWATDGNTVHITGTTTINDFATAPQAGAWMKVIFDGILTLTQSANLNLNGGGANITTAAGDMAFVYADTTTQMDVFLVRKSGAPTVLPVAITAGTPLVKNPVAFSSSTTQAHGLGSTPTYIYVEMECLTTDLNYSVGDKVNMSASVLQDASSGTAGGITVSADATNVVMVIGATIQLVNKTTFGIAAITAASWKLTCTPYKFA